MTVVYIHARHINCPNVGSGCSRDRPECSHILENNRPERSGKYSRVMYEYEIYGENLKAVVTTIGPLVLIILRFPFSRLLALSALLFV